MVGRDTDSDVPERPDSDPGAAQAQSDQPLLRLKEAIESERARLARAESVLGCLLMALGQAEEYEVKDVPYFADVAGLAQEIIRDSINKLDSVHIGPLIERVRRS